MNRFKSASWVVLLVLLSPALSAQEGHSDQEKYDQYQQQLKDQFKKESWWYRTWNRYEVCPGFSKYSIGPAFVQPLLNWKDVKDPFSLRYRSTHFEASASFWKGIRKGETVTQSYNRLSMGYFTPIHKISIGKRFMDVKGFLVQPTASLGYTYTAKEHGAYLSPGLHFQFPFFLVAARANVEYTLGNGFNVFPEISIQLDALRTLLDPHKVKTGKFNSQHTSATPLGGGWYSVRTSYSSTDFHIKDIGPFWGLTPRVGLALPKWADQPYQTYGIGLTGRVSFVGIDIHVDKGKVVSGVVPNVNDLNEIVKAKFNNDKVAGTVNTTEVTFEGNINLVGLYLSIFKKNAIREMGNTTTPLNRFNFHLGVTHFVPGQANYLNADTATAYVDRFFTEHPDVPQDAINDPLQHQSEWGVTYGVSYEMGAIGLRVNNKISKSIGKGSTVEFYYVLPLTKIIKVYKK